MSISPCERTREQLHSFIDGVLDAAQTVEMSAHLELCPSCLRELQALKATVALVRAAPAPDGRYAKQRALITLQNAVVAPSTPHGAFHAPLRWATASLAMATLLLLTFHPGSDPGISVPLPSIRHIAAGGGKGLPTSDELDEMASLHAVHSIAVATGDEGIQQETLADANSRLHYRNP